MTQNTKKKPGLLGRYLPILRWLPCYHKEWLTGDIVAGLSVWALMVPQCLGFAAICGGILTTIRSLSTYTSLVR